MSVECVKALYDFEGLSVEELSFKKGDIITVFRRDIGGGWWEGAINGIFGLFPENYVEPCEPPRSSSESEPDLDAEPDEKDVDEAPSFSLNRLFQRSEKKIKEIYGELNTSSSGLTFNEELNIDKNGWVPSMDAFEVVIGRCEKKQGTIQLYMTYEVFSPFSNKGVFRRFKNFESLHKHLTEHYPFVIVPAIPEKQMQVPFTNSRFETEFVQQRKRRLERFLNRIAQHPVLRNSAIFHHFLKNLNFEKIGPKRVYEGQAMASAFLDAVKFQGMTYDHSEQIEKFMRFIRLFERRIHAVCIATSQIQSKHEEIDNDLSKLSSLIEALLSNEDEKEKVSLKVMEKIVKIMEKEKEKEKERERENQSGSFSSINLEPNKPMLNAGSSSTSLVSGNSSTLSVLLSSTLNPASNPSNNPNASNPSLVNNPVNTTFSSNQNTANPNAANSSLNCSSAANPISNFLSTNVTSVNYSSSPSPGSTLAASLNSSAMQNQGSGSFSYPTSYATHNHGWCWREDCQDCSYLAVGLLHFSATCVRLSDASKELGGLTKFSERLRDFHREIKKFPGIIQWYEKAVDAYRTAAKEKENRDKERERENLKENSKENTKEKEKEKEREKEKEKEREEWIFALKQKADTAAYAIMAEINYFHASRMNDLKLILQVGFLLIITLKLFPFLFFCFFYFKKKNKIQLDLNFSF